jgi:uncharacterized protein (TIGR02246 family)
MRATILGVAAAALLSLVGCTEAPPPAPDTREADAKAIRDGEVAWNQDWAAKDVEKIVGHYADDANLEVPEMPIVSGKDAIRTTLKGLLMDPNLSLTFATVQVEVAKGGELAYSRGTYTMIVSDAKSKKPRTEKGKYVTVYRKGTDGAWKAIQDINNSDAPAK